MIMLLFYSIYNKMQGKNAALGITRKLYQIVISPQKEHSNKKEKNVDAELQSFQSSVKQKQVNKDMRRLLEQFQETKVQLQRQREVTFIMQGYLAKIERVVYNKESHIFDGPLLDYEKTELHLRELVRRLSDVHNQKLNAVPVVYRNNNLKVYRHTTRHQ